MVDGGTRLFKSPLGEARRDPGETGKDYRRERKEMEAESYARLDSMREALVRDVLDSSKGSVHALFESFSNKADYQVAYLNKSTFNYTRKRIISDVVKGYGAMPQNSVLSERVKAAIALAGEAISEGSAGGALAAHFVSLLNNISVSGEVRAYIGYRISSYAENGGFSFWKPYLKGGEREEQLPSEEA